MHTQLLIRRQPAASHICIEGSVDASNARAVAQAIPQDVRALADGDGTIHLDFEGLELDDGHAVVEVVNALRTILEESAVVIHHAPQMLAHTLYKTGMLRGTRLSLEEPRVEEP
ncbi:MAG: hypothetical protein KC731_27650 [Myxococcales bacterium]|nr:hypothetical protein [Myxococcales bacterium]